MRPQTEHKKLKTVYRQLHLNMKWMWPTAAVKSCTATAQRKQRVLSKFGAISPVCLWVCASAPVCACQAASPSIWITLMKGERGNNQRSQYFTLDTDACAYAAGRRDLLAAQLSSDLTLRFNATFLSPAHSSRFLSHSLGAPATPSHLPLSTQPACLTAAKG